MRWVGDLAVNSGTVAIYAVDGEAAAHEFVEALRKERGGSLSPLTLDDGDREVLREAGEGPVITYDGSRLVRADGTVLSLDSTLSGTGSNDDATDQIAILYPED